MPKPNYSFEKRQRELAKKRKKEDKAARKAQPRGEGGDAPGMDADGGPTEHPSETTPAAGTAVSGDDQAAASADAQGAGAPR